VRPFEVAQLDQYLRQGVEVCFLMIEEPLCVQGSGFRVQGSGFRVQGSGFRVESLGCWPHPNPLQAEGGVSDCFRLSGYTWPKGGGGSITVDSAGRGSRQDGNYHVDSNKCLSSWLAVIKGSLCCLEKNKEVELGFGERFVYLALTVLVQNEN